MIVRNTEVELSLNRKHQPRYLGPFEVAERTQKGNYKLKELDGTVLKVKYAAFRVLPYITRNHIFMKDHQEDESEETDTDSISDSPAEQRFDSTD